MMLRESIDMARYSPRLWWLMLASIAARFSAERSSSLIDSLPSWLGVLAACVILRCAARRRRNPSVSARRTGIVVGGLSLVPAMIHLANGEWLPALLVLLLAVQAGAYIAAEQRREVWLMLGAAFVLLLFTAVQAHSALFLLCAAALTLLTLNVLGLDDRDRRSTAATLEPASPGRPAGGLLFVGITLLLAIPTYLFLPKPEGWPRSEQQQTPPPAPENREATTALDPPPPPLQLAMSEESASLAAAPLPRPDTIARPERDDYGEDFGMTDVQRDKPIANDIMLYARSSYPVNLRGRVYDRFADNRWSRTLTGSQRIELDAPGTSLSSESAGATVIAQSIEVANELDPTLVHAPGVRSLQFPAAAVLQYDDGVLVADEPLRAGIRYSTQSRLAVLDGRYLLQEPPPADIAPYLQAEGASQRLRELAISVTAQHRAAQDKAMALESYLRTNYTYTYETIGQQNYTPLDWFLFEGRRGHCEFFASALTMLLRSVGIPARLATGFALGDPNPVTGFYEVRALDGHAWVEVYLDGEGWLMLEPTPFYPLPKPEIARQVAEQMDGYLDRLAATRQFIAPGTFQTRVTVLTRDLWRGTRSALSALASSVRALGWLLPLAVAGIIAAAVGLYLLGIAARDVLENLQIRRCVNRLDAHDTRAATLLLAAAVLRMAAPRRFARREDWTLREYSQQLREAATLDRNGRVLAIPDEFLEAFDAARYGSPAATSMPPMLSTVIEVVRAELRSNPWPRLRAAATRLQTMTVGLARLPLLRRVSGTRPG